MFPSRRQSHAGRDVNSSSYNSPPVGNSESREEQELLIRDRRREENEAVGRTENSSQEAAQVDAVSLGAMSTREREDNGRADNEDDGIHISGSREQREQEPGGNEMPGQYNVPASSATVNNSRAANDIPLHVQRGILDHLRRTVGLPNGSSVQISRDMGGNIVANVHVPGRRDSGEASTAGNRNQAQDDSTRRDPSENSGMSSSNHSAGDGSNPRMAIRISPRDNFPPRPSPGTSPRVGRRSIRLEFDPSSGQPPMSANMQSGGGGGGEVSLPPLTPLVLSDNEQDIREIEEMEDFICPVCYEYLDRPCTCGSCSTRFCRQCLHTARQSSGRCPTCRNQIKSIVPDISTFQKMEEQGNVPCRFVGCDIMLPLTRIRHHEKSHCHYVKVACRYHSFGCRWKGHRQAVRSHEDNECALHRVQGLVQQHRILSEQADRQSQEVYRRFFGLVRLVEEMQRRESQLARQTSTHILHTVPYGLLVLISPAHILKCRLEWSAMWRDDEGSALVFNVWTIFPNFLLACRLMLNEYVNVTSTISLSSFSVYDPVNFNNLLDAVATFVALALVLALIIFCFHTDSASSCSWRSIRVPRTSIRRPFIGYITSVSFALMNMLMFDIAGSQFSAATLFLVLSISSTCISNVISGFSLQLASHPPRELSSDSRFGRAGLPVEFGLLYGFLFYFLDPISCLVGVLMHYAIDRTFSDVFGTFGRQNSPNRDPPPPALLTLRTGMIGFFLSLQGMYQNLSPFPDMITAVILLVTLNLMLTHLSKLFALIGRYLFTCALEQVRRNKSNSTVGAGLGIAILSLAAYAVLATV